MINTLTMPDANTFVDMPEPGAWSIQWRGIVYGEADVTGQHLAVLALIAGTDDFESLDIDPRHGHQRLMMMIAAIVAVDAVEALGPDAGEDDIAGQVARSVAEVSEASVEEILGALRF